jgi:hypothetical protein
MEVQGKMEHWPMPWSLKTGLLMHDEDELRLELLFAEA